MNFVRFKKENKMYRNVYVIMIGLLVMLLALQACAPTIPSAIPEPQAQPANVEQISDPGQAASPESSASNPLDSTATAPAEVARQFFEAYTTAIRKTEPTLGNSEFEAQKYLSPAYIQQVAEIKAGFDGFGFDPVLQAQDVPPAPLEVKDASVDGTQATVVLQFGRDTMEQPFERSVSLELIDGQWLIVPDRVEESAATPEEAVAAFYTWYLSYIEAEAEPRNPLVDQAYRAAPYLAPTLIAKIDRLIEESEGLHFDPFLCAQDIPTEVRTVASYDNGSRPVVMVETSFSGHYITLDLFRPNFNQWAISFITCGNNPAGVAKAFYTWALGYMTEGGEMHNPWIDGAHRQSRFLSQAFIQKLDELLASPEPLMADPVFLAQDLPVAFSTAACDEADCALVNMQYGDSQIRQLRVDTVSEEGSLRIASIFHTGNLQPVEREGWLPLIDDQYGYAIRYPFGWRVHGLKATDQHTPEEDPVMRRLYFAPESGAEFAPLSLDVIIWSEADLSKVYYLGERLEDTQVNGYAAQIYRSDPGIIFYVFRHPARPDLWIILSDSITQFPGREELARSVEGIFETFVSTITFK